MDKKVNAFTFVDNEEVILKQAKESEQRWAEGKPIGELDGLLVSIKDLLNVKGVKRLRESGAIIFGKTTSPMFGWKGVTDSPVSGNTSNPFNFEKTAGGSSGGCSAAVGLGMGSLSMGTDGGGSVRIPAAFSGISTIKPTHSLVGHCISRFGTLATTGPMARSIEDCALALNIIGVQDNDDWHSVRHKVEINYLTYLNKPLKDLKIAFSLDFNGMVNVHPEILESFKETLKKIESVEGITLTEAFPDLGNYKIEEIFNTIWSTGCARTYELNNLQMEDIDEGLRNFVRKGFEYTSVDYIKAENSRYEIGVIMNKFHEKYDLLLTPTLPLPAFTVGKEYPEENNIYGLKEGNPKAWPFWTPFTYLFNLTRQPASSVPIGFTKDGLPIGLQVVGRLYDDDLVLNASHRIQKNATEMKFPF